MRIAFISYELPPDTAFGGIATYTRQISECLVKMGCDVEVFAGSHTRSVQNELLENGVRVHRIKGATRELFREYVAAAVKERHAVQPFDIIEGPEYGAEGIRVKEALPEVPFVVKFHIPTFLIKELHYDLKKHRPKYRLKKFFGLDHYNRHKDEEYKMAKGADAWVSPSKSLAAIVAERWGIAHENIHVIPNPFFPDKEFLNIPINTATNTVTYLGRLETRKGVHLLAEAVPGVLKAMPNVHFRFIGKTNIGPAGKGTMLQYLKEKLAPWQSNIEFIEGAAPQEIPGWLAKTDVCVFNSLWENFPNVCLEAMSAGRGIVASQNGGMHDMLHDVNGGLLVDPYNIQQLQDAMTDLLQHPQKRMEMAERSREKIIRYYADEVPRTHLQFYQNTINVFEENRLRP